LVIFAPIFGPRLEVCAVELGHWDPQSEPLEFTPARPGFTAVFVSFMGFEGFTAILLGPHDTPLVVFSGSLSSLQGYTCVFF
jgi:hypothetical protein